MNRRDDDKKKDEKKVEVKIDVDNIQHRIAVLPVAASNYFNITALENKVYYNRRGSKDDKAKLFCTIWKTKETELGDFGNYEISADGKR